METSVSMVDHMNLNQEEEDEFRSDEDRIINNIVIEGNSRVFDDTDFLPIRQSLYTNVSEIPEYDGDTFHRVVWCRPNVLVDFPDYFLTGSNNNSNNNNNNSPQLGCIQGTLPDEIFMGALMAVASYLGRDLIENIIASKPNDFKTYGIYTCRFYVEGEWVEVITDTNLPCLRDENTGDISLAYSQSIHNKELWVPFIEKAYAKAVGSYEAIQKVRVHEALLHLTGGSVQQVSFRDATNKEFSMSGGTFKFLNRVYKSDTLILLVPFDKANKDKDKDKDNSNTNSNSNAANITTTITNSTTENNTNNNSATATVVASAENSMKMLVDVDNDDVNDMFHLNRIYSVIACRDIGGFELLLLHNPWGNNKCWYGSWSDGANDWDLYPEIHYELENDETLPWKRYANNGYFWMSGKMVHKYFNTAYTCKLFPSDKFSFYCVKGEWKEKTAGGGINMIRERGEVLKDTAASRLAAQQKATPVAVIDGEISWFNNPQYRVLCTKSCLLYISILPTSGSEDHKTHMMTLTVTSMPVTASLSSQKHLWESALVETVAAVRADSNHRVKGQEASVWAVVVDPHKIYHIVPHTLRPALEGAFIIRIFSTEPVTVEKVLPLETRSTHGSWTKTGDNDTTGGPLVLKKENIIKQNAKWCQNPQYHLEMLNPYSKEQVYLKIVLRRFDRDSSTSSSSAANNNNSTMKRSDSGKLKIGKLNATATTAGTVAGQTTGAPQSSATAEGKEVTVGMVICRADCLEEAKAEATRKKRQPKENYLGEIMAIKESTLKSRIGTAGSVPGTAPGSAAVSGTSGGGGNNTANTTTGGIMAPSSSQAALHPTTAAAVATDNIRTILRKVSLEKEAFYVESTCTSKSEATIFFPKLPRSWMQHGVIVIPFLSEKNIKANFELDIYSSESVKLTHMPDGYSRCVAGEWKENHAGGSHLLPTWKKNPKYNLKVRNSSYGATSNVRISLTRFGNKWKNICKKDTVGCMIGFYVFKTKLNTAGNNNTAPTSASAAGGIPSATTSGGNELTQIYESDFVPVDEICTEPSFQLGPLATDEVYTIMPTTFGEGKMGAFVLTVMSERDFTLRLDKQ